MSRDQERARRIVADQIDRLRAETPRKTSQRERARQAMAEIFAEERAQAEPARKDRLEQVNALDRHIDRMEVAVEVIERYIEEPGMPGVVIEAATLLREEIAAAREVSA